MKQILCVMVISLVAGCYGRESVKTDLEGKAMPGFTVRLQDSTAMLTSNIPAGKPFVIVFFGPYCPYSKAQIEQIIKRQDALKDIHFYLVTSFPYKDMNEFGDHYKIKNYSGITIGSDETNFFARYFNAMAVPYITIFGADKKLIKAFEGMLDVAQIKEMVQQ